MSIAYVVFTCKKYIDSRVKWQLSTCFSSVDSVYYLGHEMDGKRTYWWGASDEYVDLPHKLFDFFKHMDLKEDWIVIMDDDTFVFHDRLCELLQNYSPSHPISIGHIMTHIKETWGVYHSGGAGTVLSQTAYQQLKQLDKQIIHWCADICLGSWLKQIQCPMIHHNGFHTDLDTDLDKNKEIDTAITFHHLKGPYQYLRYQKANKKNGI